MPYEFLEDVATADVACRAWGASLDETFGAAADATMNVMVEDLATIARRVEKAVEAEADAADLLLVEFLQALIYYKDAEQLLLRPAGLTISRREAGLAVSARLTGEPLNPQRHELKVDVKAVTFHRLRVERTADGWEAFVVLDI
jgi:SHS2 domain-containing protein